MMKLVAPQSRWKKTKMEHEPQQQPLPPSQQETVAALAPMVCLLRQQRQDPTHLGAGPGPPLWASRWARLLAAVGDVPFLKCLLGSGSPPDGTLRQCRNDPGVPRGDGPCTLDTAR